MSIRKKSLGAILIIVVATVILKSPIFLAAQDKAEEVINEATPVEGDILALDNEIRNKRHELDRAHAQLLGLADDKKLTEQAKVKLDEEINDLKDNISAGISTLTLSKEPQIEHRGKVYPREQLISFLEELEDEYVSTKEKRNNRIAAINEITILEDDSRAIINQVEEGIRSVKVELQSLTNQNEKNKLLEKFTRVVVNPLSDSYTMTALKRIREKVRRDEERLNRASHGKTKFDFRPPAPESDVLGRIYESIGGEK